MKKILLSIGALTAVASPVAIVVACGKTESVSTIVELSETNQNGKYNFIKLNLDFAANSSKANQESVLKVAKMVFSEQKNKFDSANTKVLLKTSAKTIEKTYADFKAIKPNTLPDELKVKDPSINQIIQTVLDQLVAAAQ